MAIDVQKLWGIPEAPNTIKINVLRSCGHRERFPFEGIEEAAGYRMPRAEAERLQEMRLGICENCDNDKS